MELERDQFEEVAMAHFVAQRAAGVQISGDNGCEPTRESLFWRDDKGDYGVRMFNAAWWGWKEAAVSTRKTCEVPPMDEAAMARLAEIERQEPVAEMILVDMGIGDARQLRVNWLMDGYLDVGAKLYAAAGASPVEPSESVEHRDELAKRKPEPAAETVGGLAKAVKAARGGDAPPAPMRRFA